MIQRFLSCLLIIMAVTIACNDDSDKIKTFSALADISGSPSLTDNDEKYNMVVMYSTDGGATFVDWPAVAKGQSYMAKVVNRDGGDLPIQPGSCYAVDWSTSVPAPDDVQGTMATFTMGHDNALVAKVTDTDYGPFDRSYWLGAFTGDEHGTCCEGGHDKQVFRIDPSNPNAIIMNNFWGDGVDAQIVFTPSTNKNDQVITIPAQTTDDPGTITAATGTYDQCSQTIEFEAIPYTVGGKTYTFGYSIHR
jgi:hypothetical protein